MTMPSAAQFEQAGPAEIPRVQNLSGWAKANLGCNLDRPAEVHFSTRLQAHQLFASVTRGEVDFTPALHPSLWFASLWRWRELV